MCKIDLQVFIVAVSEMIQYLGVRLEKYGVALAQYGFGDTEDKLGPRS